jgi:hypothetical protein
MIDNQWPPVNGRPDFQAGVNWGGGFRINDPGGAPPAPTFFLLLETGDRLLLETGDRLIKEDG